MGYSQTINLIGCSKSDETGRQQICYAMTKLDMLQEMLKMEKRKTPIVEWYAQTKTGAKMLGKNIYPWDIVKHDSVNIKIKTVPCPACRTKGCQICNWSGITTKRHLSGYQDWQLKPDS